MTGAGLRERKKTETRTALREAAIALSLRHGPDAVTVEQICERAGVGRRTFFNYFAGKDEAIVGWTDDQLDEIAAAVIARPAEEDDARALSLVVRAVLAGLVDHTVWRAQIDLVRVHPAVAPRMVQGMQRLEDALVRGLLARAGARDVATCRTLAAIACAVLRVATSTWFEDASGASPAECFTDLFLRLEGSDLVPAVPGPRSGPTATGEAKPVVPTTAS